MKNHKSSPKNRGAKPPISRPKKQPRPKNRESRTKPGFFDPSEEGFCDKDSRHHVAIPKNRGREK